MGLELLPHMSLKRPKYLTPMDEATCVLRCETLATANVFPLDGRVFNKCVKKSVEKLCCDRRIPAKNSVLTTSLHWNEVRVVKTM